jgi:hypothetical protein
LGASPHVRFVLGLGADAGNGQEFLERRHRLLAPGIDGLKNGLKHSGRLPAAAESLKSV